ncbi:MAG: SDR family oxidoreductase [Roseiflexaceae bacterium]|nr:SDR family oxidoreductase [Roseiflexaceae bacterium]
MNFTSQIILVAGGSGGIGRSVVRMLAERGAHVLAGYHTRADAAATTLAQCEGLPGVVVAHQVDVRLRESADAFVQAALDRWGQIDGLINCAGVVAYAPINAISLTQWQSLLATNLDGVYHMCKAAIRPMMKRRSGRIVNVAALHGVAGSPEQADYSAATGGVLGLTRALARETAAWNITVNAVAPGLIATEQLEVLPAERRAWAEQIIALRRIGTPDEAAAAAVFLASPLASYITGQTIYVDGGWRMT